MLTRTRRPSRRLTPDDAVQVWLRHWRGEYQHRIAADYDVNPGRVNDVLKGRLYPETRTVAVKAKLIGLDNNGGSHVV